MIGQSARENQFAVGNRLSFGRRETSAEKTKIRGKIKPLKIEGQAVCGSKRIHMQIAGNLGGGEGGSP